MTPHIFVFFSHWMPKIMLSPNDPSFFEPVLTLNAPACLSVALTPVSISYLTAPPPPVQNMMGEWHNHAPQWSLGSKGGRVPLGPWLPEFLTALRIAKKLGHRGGKNRETEGESGSKRKNQEVNTKSGRFFHFALADRQVWLVRLGKIAYYYSGTSSPKYKPLQSLQFAVYNLFI